MPIYDSLPLNIQLSEAYNFYYYNLTSLHLTTQHLNSMIIVQLHIPQDILLRFVSTSQVANFARDYISSHMISITGKHYLPTLQLPQRLHRVNYDLQQITSTLDLFHNYAWNYHMPLHLPELLDQLDQAHQLHQAHPLQEHHYKALHTILHKTATYYGFAILTATNLTMQHRAQLHNFLTTTGQTLAPPEYDYSKLRGGPNSHNTFTTAHFSTLDHRTQMVQNYRVQNWTKHTSAAV